MIQKVRNFLSLAACLLLSIPSFGQEAGPVVSKDSVEVTQDTTAEETPKPFRFIVDEENRINNAVSLSGFFEKLYQLKKGQNIRVNIVQIGDSHIQADFLTRVVRQNFQTDFGNGGRGLIVAGRVANTSQPSNLYSSSAFAWESKRIVNPEKSLPIGVGGITIRSVQPNASFTIRTRDATPLDYRFNKVTLFYKKDSTSFNIGIRDSVNRDLAFVGPYTIEPFPNSSSVILPFLTHQVTFQLLPSATSQSQATIFGINLENDKPGTIYHAIGVNGAKFKNFGSARLFADQTSALRPDLIILSLGTNEALEYPYADPQLSTYIDILVKNLKESNPQTPLLFTTIPDSYRRKRHRNPGVENVRSKVIEYADLHNLAFWDLYTVGGGKHSADFWQKNHLMQRDGVHFTVKGYELQGNLFYQALMKSYDEYVGFRHP